jgi:hypothetical protein
MCPTWQETPGAAAQICQKAARPLARRLLRDEDMSLDPSFSAPTFDANARFADPVAAMPSVNRESRFWGEDGLRFGDLLDAINPLQHIPVVSTVYRALTGDEIAPGARLAGGTLFGGPLGFLSSLANTVIEGATGRDASQHMLALLPGGDRLVPGATATAVATNATPGGNRQTAAAGTMPGQEAPLAQQVSAAPADTNAGALAALRRDLQAAKSPNIQKAAASNLDALAALRRDLQAGAASGSQTGTTHEGDRGIAANGNALAALRHDLKAGASAQPDGSPRPATAARSPHLFAASLPKATATEEPIRADGRKPGEYSAAELASIYRSYQRAAETAADSATSSRVED